MQSISYYGWIYVQLCGVGELGLRVNLSRCCLFQLFRGERVSAIPRHRQSNCICTVMLNIYYFSVDCFILRCTCVCWCDSVEDGIIVSQWADDSLSAVSAARVGLQLSVRAWWTWTCPVQRCMMFTVDFFYLCPHLCICLTVSGITRKTAGGFLWYLGNRSTV